MQKLNKKKFKKKKKKGKKNHLGLDPKGWEENKQISSSSST